MKFERALVIRVLGAWLLASGLMSSAAWAGGTDPYGQEDPNKKIIKSGLLGAGTGAIASSASGGDAGKGALIGAGTNVIGGALLDALTGPSQSAPRPVYQQAPVQQQAYSQQGYAQQQPVYQQQTYYEPPAPAYYAPAPPPAEDPTKKILKSGLLGAGTGAIASSASGGDAGKGALIGAGTNVIGGALLDMLTGPSQPQQQPVYYQQQQPVYYQQQPAQQYASPSMSSNYPQPTKKIIRKYDSEGKVIEEQEVYQ